VIEHNKWMSDHLVTTPLSEEATKRVFRVDSARRRVCEHGEVSLGQFEDSFELVVHVGSIGYRLTTVGLRQARNIRFGHAGRTSQVSWTQPDLFQPVPREQCKIHGLPVGIGLPNHLDRGNLSDDRPAT
jgi:hypothetical protein